MAKKKAKKGVLLKSLADQAGTTVANAKKAWVQANAIARANLKWHNGEEFWGYVVATTKNLLKAKKEARETGKISEKDYLWLKENLVDMEVEDLLEARLLNERRGDTSASERKVMAE